MFQSLNYFKTIKCPFQDEATNKCERPYCHYKHIKTQPSVASEQNTSININDIQIELPKSLTSSSYNCKNNPFRRYNFMKI